MNQSRMTNITSNQELAERIERIVQEHISATRAVVQAAVERAFASQQPVTKSSSVRSRRTSRPRLRRASEEVAALGERLYQAVCTKPGETMMVLAPMVGGSARELHRPMMRLKGDGRVRCVGSRSSARYFPIAEDTAAAAE